MKFTAVIVGCGSIAPKHAEGIINSGNSLVAAFDTDAQKLGLFCEKYNCKGYTDFETMLENESPDAVHICTPHYLHYDMATFALEKDIAVFLEKPPVVSKTQLENLKVRSKNKRLTVCFQNRFNKSTDKVKEIIASGVYGKLLGANASVTWKRDGEYYTKSEWRGTKDKECGGVIINQAIHTVDLLCYLLGKPDMVKSMTSNLCHDYIEVEDTACAVIDFKDRRATFFATTCACSSPSATISLCFEKAVVEFDNKFVSVHTKEINTTDFDTSSNGKECWGSAHSVIIDKFYKYLDGGNNPCSIEDCESAVSIMLDIYGKGKI